MPLRTCDYCQEPSEVGDVFPFGTSKEGHTWLHPGCWERVYKTNAIEPNNRPDEPLPPQPQSKPRIGGKRKPKQLSMF